MITSEDIQFYHMVNAEIDRLGGDSANPDDVMDAFVELTMNKSHFTDEQLQAAAGFHFAIGGYLATLR